jgi:hypothetical protein
VRIRSRLATATGPGLRIVVLGVPLLALGLVLAPAVAGESPSPDASAAPDASPGTQPLDAAVDQCVACHSKIDAQQRTISDTWLASVHGKVGIGCAECHGGDATSDEITVAMSPGAGFRGVPDRTETVAVCGTCHSDAARMRPYGLSTDQLSKYQSSVHGQKLATDKDTRVAICVDCHGSHGVKKASDPTADVYPLNVPKLCSSCHADAKLMEPYGIPTDQYEIYSQSVHGKALLEDQDMRAPTCASCHGSHSAKPPQSSEVVDVCGKCHTATQALYEESRHAKLGAVGPKCWTCHGTHDVAQPDESRFFHEEPPQYDCATCHNLTDQTLRLSVDRFEDDADRRCDTCHHPQSIIYSQAEGIHDSLDRASTAYTDAEGKIKDAAQMGMIVADADVQLTQALTSLIQARAAVHTTKLTTVAGLADEASAKAADAQALADAKLEESLFRREAMVVVVGIIIVNVGVLLIIKRRLGRSSA